MKSSRQARSTGRPARLSRSASWWPKLVFPAAVAHRSLFFAVYGQALQAPDRFADFLDHVVTEPVTAFSGTHDDGSAQRTATLVIASIRGLLLDLLTSDDPDRVNAAADALFASLAPERGG